MIGNKLTPFKIWCQKVLPTVYDDSLSYYEALNKVTEFLNEVIEQMNTLTQNVEDYEENLTGEWDTYKTDLNAEWLAYKNELTSIWEQYKDYIDTYFANLDVQEEINNKLDEMASDGSLDALLLPYFNTYKNEINQIVATQNNKISVLEGRVDEITELPDGSTSGDAELADIRVPQATFNGGNNYNTAGNAVRGQVGALKKYNDIEEVHANNVFNLAKYSEIKFDTFLQGYYENNTLNTNSDQITTEYMKLPSGYVKVTTDNSMQIIVNTYELSVTGIQRVTHAVYNNEVLISYDSSKYITFGLYDTDGVEPSDGTNLHAIVFNFADKGIETEINAQVGSQGFANIKGLFAGTINEYGALTTNSNQYSICGLIKFPKGSKIMARSLISDVTAYIKAFEYSNGAFTRVSNSSDGVTTMKIANGEYYYSISFYKSTSFTKPADNEYEIIIGAYDKLCYAKTNSSTVKLMYKDIIYTLYHQISASINLDSWRLYTGVCNGTEMWNNSDAEGPIKLVGDSDFIGGYHGDEIMQNATLYADNTDISDLSLPCGVCNSFTLEQESICYKADTQTQAFTRYKKVVFEKGNYDVQQKWIALINCQIERGALCLFQCPKSILHGWDSETTLPRHSNDGTASLHGDTKGTMYVDSHRFTLIAEYGQQFDGYQTYCTDFTSRLKFYFDMYNGKELSINDVINSKFKVIVDEV